MERRLWRLSDVFEREGRCLYALLIKLTLSEEASRELLQELFLKLARFKKLNEITNLSAYVHRAAINLALDWRHKQSQKHLSLEDAQEPISNELPPLVGLIKKEELEDLLDAICQLNETSREAFVMRYIEKKSYLNISKQLGKTSHQTRAICFKALNHVRHLITCKPQSFQKKETL